jgi:anti-sigma factor RsiW
VNCARLALALNELSSRGLAAAETAELETHAQSCAACAELLRASKGMSCRDFVALIPTRLEGGLGAAEEQRYERHLALCADCRAYLASYQQAIALTAAAFHEEAPALDESLVRSILARRPPTEPPDARSDRGRVGNR